VTQLLSRNPGILPYDLGNDKRVSYIRIIATSENKNMRCMADSAGQDPHRATMENRNRLRAFRIVSTSRRVAVDGFLACVRHPTCCRGQPSMPAR